MPFDGREELNDIRKDEVHDDNGKDGEGLSSNLDAQDASPWRAVESLRRVWMKGKVVSVRSDNRPG